MWLHSWTIKFKHRLPVCTRPLFLCNSFLCSSLPKSQKLTNFSSFILYNVKKQIALCEIAFENSRFSSLFAARLHVYMWKYCQVDFALIGNTKKLSSTDSKVRTACNDSIIHSESWRVICNLPKFDRGLPALARVQQSEPFAIDTFWLLFLLVCFRLTKWIGSMIHHACWAKM